MTPAEQLEAVEKRLSRAGMSIDEETLKKIINTARGMPGYTHLLGMFSAKAAIEAKTIRIKDEHLMAALPKCLEESGESTRQAYAMAAPLQVFEIFCPFQELHRLETPILVSAAYEKAHYPSIDCMDLLKDQKPHSLRR